MNLCRSNYTAVSMAPSSSNPHMQAQIERLDQVLKGILERHVQLQTQEDIARELGYSRPATLSDYKNPRLYSEAKLRQFAQLLSLYFRVNPDYLLDGRGTPFLEQGQALSDQPLALKARDLRQRIQSLELACRLLEAQLRQLSDSAS